MDNPRHVGRVDCTGKGPHQFGRAHRVASTDVGTDRALLVHVDIGRSRDSEARLAELGIEPPAGAAVEVAGVPENSA